MIFWQGTPDTLETANEKCWDFLDQFEMSTHLCKPVTKFARAPLCVLESLGDDEAGANTADWFAEVAWDSW